MPDDVRRRPVGVFDSGVGGLTVLHELLVRLPHEDYLYLADSARLPYGSRDPRELEAFALEIAEAMLARRIKLLVVACNSATAAALPALRERMMQTTLGVDVLGVVQPAAVQAVAATRRGKIGVLGTPATVATGAYGRAIAGVDPFVEVDEVPCGDLARCGSRPARSTSAAGGGPQLLRAAARAGVDTVILGCTHYPLVRPIIQRMLGLGPPSSPPARRWPARSSTCSAPAGSTAPPRGRAATTSSAPATAAFRAQGTRFLQLPLGEVGHVAARRGGGGMSAPRAQRRPRRGRPAARHDRARLRRDRDRLRPDLLRRDPRDLHRVRAGVGPALDGSARAAAGSRPSTGCSRPRRQAEAARHQQGPGRRPHGRDPAPDRPLAARHHRLRGDGRAHDLRRLRRPHGRRRHPLRLDHRRLRRARARAQAARRGGGAAGRPLTGTVAAVSCGIVGGTPLLDLDYPEDSTAEVDANVVMTGDGGLVEVQATAERTPLSRAHLDELLALAQHGIDGLRAAQTAAVAWPGATMRLVLATRNDHKVRELSRLMPGAELEPLPAGRHAPARGRRHVRRQRARQGACRRAGARRPRDRRRLRASRPMRSAAPPGSTPPASPGRTPATATTSPSSAPRRPPAPACATSA